MIGVGPNLQALNEVAVAGGQEVEAHAGRLPVIDRETERTKLCEDCRDCDVLSVGVWYCDSRTQPSSLAPSGPAESRRAGFIDASISKSIAALVSTILAKASGKEMIAASAANR